ncbi:Ribosome maturation factor RimM [Candidatus Hydrogenisulfobacillus filiaventi]|uniref:Ribosome maturation factor RimM n=1 Tax=Candidatus Hydrogenisulfobacillus filiaventi TaxID=2707344 RepID=A0A6F8ZGG7_9FIRM|nr:ribosome maturation factor RimM [Bacillota bacterium]CAB1129085.1 Ribosome maturation factor RimM [Candidatus Hydrogenisulfobacillus filiaventi]
MTAPGARIALGEVVAPQGLDGSLRVYPSMDAPQRLVKMGTVFLEPPGQPAQARRVLAVRVQGELVILRLEGVEDRTAAERLRGARLWVPPAALPPLPEGEYYWFQLIGLRVRDRKTGGVVGTVVHVLRTRGVHDVLEVQLDQGGSALVPALKAVIPRVDLAAGELEVDPLPGLWEAGRPGGEEE